MASCALRPLFFYSDDDGYTWHVSGGDSILVPSTTQTACGGSWGLSS